MKPKTHLRISTLPYGGFILKLFQQLQSKVGASVVIQGSYNTSNIGDLAIGYMIQKELKKMGIHSHLNGFINDYWGRTPNFKNYDYHIIGGGGVIRDYPKGYLETRLKPIGTAKRGSVIMSVGFDGICTEKGKKLIKRLNECEFITVRDEKSQESLQPFIDKKLEISACPTFLMTPTKTHIPIPDKNVIGLNLHNFYENCYEWGDYVYYPKRIDLKERRKQYLDYINKTLKCNLKEIAKENQIVFIPFAKQDIVFAKEYLNEIPMRIMPLQSPQETLDTIQKVDKMICMRYHSIVFSILAQKPVFIISYQNKTKELTKKLKGVTFVDFSDPPEQIEVDFTINSSRIYNIKEKMIRSAKKNFEKLKSLIEYELPS